MGLPSYLEDIHRRRDESGAPPIDERSIRPPRERRDDMAEWRQDAESRKAAHTSRYRARRKRNAIPRTLTGILRALFRP